MCLGVANLCVCLSACGDRLWSAPPTLEFTTVPETDWGGSSIAERIEGRARGFKKGQRIVLYAKSGAWWIQPSDEQPFTAIEPDATWKNSAHLGTDYAALLVEPGYSPPATANIDALPDKGGGVVAVATVHARPGPLGPKKIRFSGYDWDVRQLPSNGGGTPHANSASNVWTDEQGFLHLRIAHNADGWTCAEMNLSRSLGYGSYSFFVRGGPPLEPATVLGLFTYDHSGSGTDHREIDIELSQWGDPAIKSAQFVIQPFYVPANVFRYVSPAGPALTHSFRWEAGRVSFKTVEENSGRVIAEHAFTSGIPSPGEEKVHLNLYIYGRARTAQKNGAEVVIEKFQYLP